MISYDIFISAFLSKIDEYNFLCLCEDDVVKLADGYLKRAVSDFKHVCKYDLTSNAYDVERMFDVDIKDEDLDEIVNIISEGMVLQWMKPYLYKQELLETVLNTRDFVTYSPAELLLRVGNAYAKVQKDYTQMIREYSFDYGDLSRLHL